MPEPCIFAEKFCNCKHDERKSHAYRKPGEYGRKTCNKGDSPQIFKSTNPNDGGVPFVFSGTSAAPAAVFK